MKRDNTRPIRKGRLAWLLAFLAFSMAGCDWPGRPDPKDRPVPSEQIMDFNYLFKENCSGCHGSNGKLGPAPPLNDPIFLAIVPDAELLMVITEGRPGTLMPAWAQKNGGPLTAGQVKVLAEGIEKTWGPGTKPSDTPTYLVATGMAAGNRDAGEKVFAHACGVCHGHHGQGGNFGEKKVGAINDPAFLGLISDRALRRLVITGRPDLDMPTFHQNTNRGPDFKPLTEQDVADLLALLASWRQAGSSEGK